MPKYSINGHTYQSDKELSDDEIDEIGGWEKPAEKNLWEKANTPYTNKVSTLGKKVGQWIDPEQGGDWRDPRTALGAFAESVGNTVENMFFTPLGTATAIATPVSSALKAGTPLVSKLAPWLGQYLPAAAKAVHTGGRVGAGLYGLEGAKSTVEGISEGDIPKTLMGGVGAYLGQRGARAKFAPYVPPKPPASRGIPSGQEYTPTPASLGYGETPTYRNDPTYAMPYGETPRGGPGMPPPPPPPRPPNVPPPNAPMVDDIAETIRKISQGQRAPRPVEPPPPPIEDPFTPVPEPPPFDPRDPRVVGQEIPYEPPPSGEVGPPATPAMPPEITTPNMVPQRPILDRTLTQDADINPLSELAARRGAREGGAPRTAHAEPPMGLEEPVTPEVVGPPARTMADHAAEADAELAARGLRSRGTPTPDIETTPVLEPELAGVETPIQERIKAGEKVLDYSKLQKGGFANPNVDLSGTPENLVWEWNKHGPGFHGWTNVSELNFKYDAARMQAERTGVPSNLPEPPPIIKQQMAQSVFERTPKPAPSPVQQFADQVVPPTEAEAINQAIAPPVLPPPSTAPAGKKGGLRPRQKFQTQTFAPGPSKPAPVAAPPPVEAPVVPPPEAPVAAPPRLVKTKKGGPVEMTTTNAPANAPQLEHIIATNGDELQKYMAEGYQVVGKRVDGAIVMERVAAEAPPAQRSLAAEIEEGQAKVKADYEANRKARAVKWGATRSKAKALGVDLKGVDDIKAAEKLIKAKDPTWSTPEVAGGEQPSATAQERMPKKQEPWRPGGLKHGKRFDPAPDPDTGFRRWWNEARGLMSVDFPWMTSAAFRQGLPFIGTKYWKSAFSRAAKAYKSQEAYNQVMTSIEVDPLFQPSFDPRVVDPKMGRSIAEIAGLRFIKPSEIGGAEGITRGPITSKLWYTGASDRSFAAFTNHLRAWTFKRLLKDAGIWDEATKKITNEPLAREIADFVNTASGRGKLEIGYGIKKGQTRSFESSARLLTDAFFSPRLMFSRIKMMNPATYLQADPFVRKQYTSAMIRTIGAWWTIASLAEWGGKLAGEKVSVSKDPNNADFGKIRIGNTRIDPGGGFQQFLVMTHRLMPSYGKHKDAKSGIAAVDLALGLLTAGGGTTTSSVTGNKSVLGRGYKAETRWDIAERFVASKLHPSAKLAYDAVNASEKYPVYLGDRLLQMALPMMVPDVIEALQNDPEMAPMIFFASNLGMGAQTYEGGRVEKPAITAPLDKAFGTKLRKYDYAIGGK